MVRVLPTMRLDSARFNSPQLEGVERRIRPLVDALNATGLVETFASCEGHYGGGERAENFSHRQEATVAFVRRGGVTEEELSRFFRRVLADRRLRDLEGTELVIARHHVPPLDRSGGPEVFFELALRPCDAQMSADAKRTTTDQMLTVIIKCVERATPHRAPDVRARSADGRGVKEARARVPQVKSTPKYVSSRH